MRFVFMPPGTAAGLLDLPWEAPLEEWGDERLVEIPGRGLSRHVVRFVAEGGEVVALKEIPERLARREFRLLRGLQQLGIPAVEVLGAVVDREDGLDAVLATRFLDRSSCLRALLADPRGGHPAEPLMEAVVRLLVRLHRAGFMWGDCSLSNTLFRFDAGVPAAHVVDTETGELHDRLSKGQRTYDLEVALERIAGELMDLRAGGSLAEGIDPFATAAGLGRRYRHLWWDLTDEPGIASPSARWI